VAITGDGGFQFELQELASGAEVAATVASALGKRRLR
jgi:hypothetical protein